MNAFTAFTPAMFDAMRAIGDGAVCASNGSQGSVMIDLCERGFLKVERTSSQTFYEPTAMGWGAIAVLNASFVPRDNEPMVQRIQRFVAHYYSIPDAEMVSQRRSREVARPRQIAMYLARELTPLSYPSIGRRFGNRDHTTVIHAVRTIEDLIEVDRVIRDDVATLLASLRGEE